MPTRDVSGIVTDSGGAAISGKDVILETQYSNQIGSTQTAPDGSYSISFDQPLSTTLYLIVKSNPPYETKLTPFEVTGPSITVDVQLEDVDPVRGHIGEARTGGRRLGYPDWVRAQAEQSRSEANSDLPTSSQDIRINVDSNSKAKSPLPFSSRVTIIDESSSQGFSDISRNRIRTFARESESIAGSDLTRSDIFHRIDESRSKAKAETPVLSTVQDALASKTLPETGKTKSDVVVKIDEAGSVSNAPLPFSLYDTVVEESKSKAKSDIPETVLRTFAKEADAASKVGTLRHTLRSSAKESGAIAKSLLPTISTRQDAFAAGIVPKSDRAESRVVIDVEESSSVSDAPLSNSISIAIAQAKEAETTGSSSVSITTWDAGLGGVVKKSGGTPVEDAEVHVIRDNDDTLVASTTTDSNGRWHVTVRGGKTTEADPPVYSIEVWYREGPKRDSSSKVFNSTNRPFIDTSDPSETDPYNDEYYYRS